MKRSLLFFPVFLAVFACNAPQSVPTVVRMPVVQDSTEIFPGIWAADLNRDTWYRPGEISLPVLSNANDSIDTRQVLYKLYPGKTGVEDTEDSLDLTTWVCTTCPGIRLKVEDIYTEDPAEQAMAYDTFPYPVNYTRVVAALPFSDLEGRKFWLISFSTSNDWMPSGRYSYGVLGLALFEKSNNTWVLRAFDPHCDTNGSYQTAKGINEVVWTGQGQFLFSIDAGYPCGPMWEDFWLCYGYRYFYAFDRGKFSVALKSERSSAHNAGVSTEKGNDWDTDWHFTADTAGGFPAIHMMQRGFIKLHYNAKGEPDYAADFLPSGIESGLNSKKPFYFEAQTTYQYNQGGYMPVEDSMKSKCWH